MAPRFVDLFCGAGGFTDGFVAAGWKPVFAIDCDPESVDSYNRNFGEIAECGDICEKTFSDFDVDAVIGGIPCQGFTMLSRRHHQRDPRNALFREFLRAVRSIRPTYFVVENVPQFLVWWSGKELMRQ